MLSIYVSLQSLAVTGAHAHATRRDERGQATVEYLGLVMLIAAVLAAVVLTDIGSTIGGGIKNVIDAAIKKVTRS